VVNAGNSGGFLERDEVRAAVEVAAGSTLCFDLVLLNFLQIDTHDCKEKLTKINPVCWVALDKLIPEYAIPSNPTGKERFFDLVYVYLYCAKTELLVPAIKTKRTRAHGAD
jgi:hypothetical protein